MKRQFFLIPNIINQYGSDKVSPNAWISSVKIETLPDYFYFSTWTSTTLDQILMVAPQFSVLEVH
jgi:hypothetical protein